MNWDQIFSLANVWPLAFWLLLVFGPRTDLVARIILFGGIAPLALSYAILLPLIMLGGVDPVAPPGAGPADFTKLSGVIALFASEGGATVGWIHYLAFDLFVGLWIARNADQHGYSRWVQVPILFFTLMAGPLGLTLYLVLRATCKSRPAEATTPR